jgi:microcystin-dependent protein
MADPFTGEIRAFGFNYAPVDWAFCYGQSMPVQQNSVLFSVIGKAFGGDGQNNFLLPNLQGRVPVGVGPSDALASTTGAENVALYTSQMPAHTHTLNGELSRSPALLQTAPTSTSLPGSMAITTPAGSLRGFVNATSPDAYFSPVALNVAGASEPHENRQPFLSVNFCICLAGEYPASE